MKRRVKSPFLCKLVITSLLLLPLKGLRGEGVVVSIDSLKSSLTYLASQELKGRYPGTVEDSIAAHYIANHFRRAGLKPLIGESFVIPFTFFDGLGRAKVSYNIGGYIEGLDDQYLLVGAHYDHLGMGLEGGKSRYKGEPKVHPGADDNGSGVSAILEMARVLSLKEEVAGRGVAFVAFGAEEIGLIGSSRMVDTLRKLEQLPLFMLNLDMVGRLRDEALTIGGVGSFAEADSLIELVNRDREFLLTKNDSGSETSDHSIFNANSVPVLYFTTGVHTEYHTPEDSPELINFKGLAEVTSFALEVVEHLSSPTFPSNFIEQEEVGNHATTNKATVSLGVIPDLSYQKGDGFRLGPVTAGKVGDRAGLKEGDLIVEIGENPITSVYDYMEVLALFSEGDIVTIVVKRGEERVELSVEF